MDGQALVFSILAVVVIAKAVYSGVKDGVTSVVKPEEPKPQKPAKVKEAKAEPVAPPGKMWVRVGKQDLLVDSTLAEPKKKR